MEFQVPNIFHIKSEHLQQLIRSQRSVFPEVEVLRKDIDADMPQIQHVLQQTQQFMEEIGDIPQTTYSHYRLFRHTGERDQYQTSYFLKRAKLSAAALRLLLGQQELKNIVQDYIWNICEESNWVLPAHEGLLIDLFAAETAFMLAEIQALLKDHLADEINHRIYQEVNKRIFEPYIQSHRSQSWYLQDSNWNGVCNSAIAASFLLLEADFVRLTRALEIALTGLQEFLLTAFANDGSSSEGISYWHYGLFNLVALSELLYARSGGTIQLLNGGKMRSIAAFPAKLQLSGSAFASFADCDELVFFHPGIICRLAERANEPSLYQLLAQPVDLSRQSELAHRWRFPMMIRDICWWDGRQPDPLQVEDVYLPDAGIVRMTNQNLQGMPYIVCAKAGHNDEQHNHNDVGSFLIHCGGENLLTDPGRGLYSRDYFGEKRYDNIFANSYGHSVPRLDGLLQSVGRAFSGKVLMFERNGNVDGLKRVKIDFTQAYACSGLKLATRELLLAVKGEEMGSIELHDYLQFEGHRHEVEEAFITWHDCEVSGSHAHIQGEKYRLSLMIEQPEGVIFDVEPLEEVSRANYKAGVLKRLSVKIPNVSSVSVCIRMVLQARL